MTWSVLGKGVGDLRILDLDLEGAHNLLFR